MKILSLYFTGTGNGKRVIDAISKHLVSLNHNMDIIDVTREEAKNINDYDALVVVYPVYAFNTPKPIIDYVKKIDKANKVIPCAIFKHSGEHLSLNNASSLYLTRLLKKRNIKVTNEYHYLMPYCIIFRHSDYMAYRMNNVMEKLVPLDLDLFLNHQEVHLKRFFLDSLFAWIFRIEWWGGRFNGRFYKVEKDKCIKCMKCINNCPAHNITLKDDKIKFGGKCLMCQRCVMYCPTHAIKAGLFNGWRVDEPYTFKECEYQKEKHPNFCKKSYIKYFRDAEERLENMVSE